MSFTDPIESELQTLFYWMEERHQIYLRKQEGLPVPWTEDPILQSYRFCNVFRELDKVTIWFRENIREKYPNHEYLWFPFCLGRRINLIDTMEHLGTLMIDWDAEDAQEILDYRKDFGDKIYNGAYMLTTGGRSVPKNEDLCWNIIQPLWEKREEITDALEMDVVSLEDAFNLFATGHVGFSDFLAYEIVTDLRHTRYLKDAPDIYTWANAGPGAMRGLNRLFGRKVSKKIKACQANQEMQYLLQEAELYLPDWFPKLEMRDIEHSLCEVDKYLRVKNEEGNLRQKYDGKGDKNVKR